MFDRQQRETAATRANLTRAEFIGTLGTHGVAPEVADALRQELLEYCAAGVAPHPEDDIEGFYGIDADHREDLVEELFERFELPQPNPRAPEIIPEVPRVLDLAIYFDRRKRELTDG